MLMQIVYHSGGDYKTDCPASIIRASFECPASVILQIQGAQTSLGVSLYTFLCRLVRKNTEKVRTV